MRLNGVSLREYKVENSSVERPTAIAAEELEGYLKKLCEENIESVREGNTPYSIILGENLIPCEALRAKDSFLLKAEDNQIFISGKTALGTLYGTYYFLEKYLGVEWLTDDCEVVRKPTDVTLIEEIYNFSMEYRVAFCF